MIALTLEVDHRHSSCLNSSVMIVLDLGTVCWQYCSATNRRDTSVRVAVTVLTTTEGSYGIRVSFMEYYLLQRRPQPFKATGTIESSQQLVTADTATVRYMVARQTARLK